MRYLATFFTHHDALAFFSFLTAEKLQAKLMPTPRKISAACGTCVTYLADATDFAVDFDFYEAEAVYIESMGIYSKVWESKI